MSFNNVDQITGALTPVAGQSVNAISSLSVNGTPQTVTNHGVNVEVADHTITDSQWSQIDSII